MISRTVQELICRQTSTPTHQAANGRYLKTYHRATLVLCRCKH